MRLTDILDPKWIKIPLEATTKEGVIAELIAVLADSGALDRPADALRAVLDREGVRTTGIGNGLALPHGKCDGAKGLVLAFGRAAAPVDFNSVDGRPVDLFVLLISPKHMTGEHIQALARVSRFLSGEAFRQQLRAAATAEEFYRLVQEKEEQAAASPIVDR